MLPIVRGAFRLTHDPDLRFTPSGKAVASLRLVADKKKKDEATQEWVDDKVCFLRGTAWDKMAENVAESFVKGDLVLLEGALETRNYEVDGEKRVSLEVNIYDIGPSVKWNVAKQERTTRSGAASGASQPSGGGQPQPTAADPWQTPAGQPDEPPF
jgi:single-strand DNA-binding protein